MLRTVTAGLCALTLAACVDPNTVPVSVAPAAVSAADRSLTAAYFAQTLRDPDSAQYRGWQGYRLGNGDRVVCGEMNARNGFGGMDGFSPFYLRYSGNAVAMDQRDGQAVRACGEAASGNFKITG